MEKLGGVAENLENLASSAASGKSGLTGKSGGSCKAENLENSEHGKSGKLDAENLAENLEKMENLTAEKLTVSHGKFNDNLSGKFVKKCLHYRNGYGSIYITTNTTQNTFKELLDPRI